MDIYNERMPSSINRIGCTIKGLLDHLRSCYGDLNESTIFDIRVVLNEILLNAIKHGNKEDESKHVVITAGINGNDTLCITVEDEGGGYDYSSVADTEESNCRCGCGLDDMQECGRGLQIVQGLCDCIEHELGGRRIIITKKLVRT